MSNPYLLPEGNVAIAFSGGRTSAYMLHHIIEANGGLPDRVVVSFQNTGREMPETLDFIQECSDRWDVPIAWLEYDVTEENKNSYKTVNHNSASRNGEPFEALIRKKKYLPNRVARFCTADLKVRAMQKFLKDKGWKYPWTVARGLRADEPRRVIGKKSDGGEVYWHPLFDDGITRRDVSAFWKSQPFNLMLPDLDGRTQLGNCDGCFLKSEASRAAFAREYPERVKWWADMETLCSDLTNNPNGATFRPDEPWQKLINFVGAQSDWIFDTEGALCQADEGDCF